MPPVFELLNDTAFAVKFPYNKSIVAMIKRLGTRRWNPALARWEIHVSHLRETMIFVGAKPEALPPELLAKLNAPPPQRIARIRLGYLNASIAGDDLPLAELDRAASFPIAGAEFSPLFKKGRWDGRKHLFSTRTGIFPAGLWPVLRAVLDQNAFAYNIQGEDRAPLAPEPGLFRAPSTPLREYQSEVLAAALAARRGIVQIPTGGGKTILAAHIIHAVGKPAFFFVHTRDLLHQSAAVFERELGIEVGRLGDGLATIRSLTVATVQTVWRALEGVPRKRTVRNQSEDDDASSEAPTDLNEATRHEVTAALEQAGLAIFDECHHLPADTFNRIAMHAAAAGWRFGLSATPWRDDGQDLILEGALGPAICRVDYSRLIALGHLVPPHIRIVSARSPKMGGRRATYVELYAAAIVENRERNRAIAAEARAWAAEGLSVLVLVAHTAHGHLLMELLPEARFVHGGVDSEARRRSLDDLERKLHPILIATTLADEGLDLPSLGGVILAGGGKSPGRIFQRIGRALRPFPGKTAARVLDFMDDHPLLRQHGRARLDLYRHEPAFVVEGPPKESR